MLLGSGGGRFVCLWRCRLLSVPSGEPLKDRKRSEILYNDSVLDMGDEDWRLREQSMMASSARFVGGGDVSGKGPLVPLTPQVFIDPQKSQKYIAEPLSGFTTNRALMVRCVVSMKDRNLETKWGFVQSGDDWASACRNRNRNRNKNEHIFLICKISLL